MPQDWNAITETTIVCALWLLFRGTRRLGIIAPPYEAGANFLLQCSVTHGKGDLTIGHFGLACLASLPKVWNTHFEGGTALIQATPHRQAWEIA